MAMISAQLAMMNAIRLAEYNKTKEKEKKDMAEMLYYIDKDEFHKVVNNEKYSLDDYTQEVITMWCRTNGISMPIVTEDNVWDKFLEMVKYKFENEMWNWILENEEDY